MSGRRTDRNGLAEARSALLAAGAVVPHADAIGQAARLRTAPRVSGSVAVLRFSSPHQVRPTVAAAWSRRLVAAMVLAASGDYVPGRVSFAVRGHARATGGTLAPEDFERLLSGPGAAA